MSELCAADPVSTAGPASAPVLRAWRGDSQAVLLRPEEGPARAVRAVEIISSPLVLLVRRIIS